MADLQKFFWPFTTETVYSLNINRSFHSHSPWQPSFYFLRFWLVYVLLMSGIRACLAFCGLLISHSIMFLMFLNTVSYDRLSFFLRLHHVPLCIMFHNFFIHPSVDEDLACLHILAMLNNALMNIGVQKTFQDPALIFLHVYQRGVYWIIW